MNKFWTMVNKVIADANILILVLDARMVNETRNDEIELKVAEAGKPLIYVINKCDLVDKHIVEEHKKRIPNSMFLSARDHLGTTKLRTRIMMTASKYGIRSIKVGVLGYPNVGKSSVINALKGRSAAPTSSMSGYTKHIRKVKTSKITLLDTPGVIPYSDTHHGNNADGKDIKSTIIGSIDHTRDKHPDTTAVKLLEQFPGLIESYYEVEENEDKEQTLEDIALKRNLKAKGNTPDMMRAARMILKDWQTGVLRRKKRVHYTEKDFR